MSKIDELASTISHWRNGEKKVSIDTNFYVFREAQATATASYYDMTTWDWNDVNINIQEVGIRPYMLQCNGALRDNIESISLPLPYSYDVIVREFENEEWTNHADSEVKSNDGLAHRAVLPAPKSLILKEILEFVSSDKVKNQIIQQLYKDFPSIQSDWEGWTPEQMSKATVWGGQFLKDSPGYLLEKHLDTKLQVATGLIYFTENDNPDIATTYYTDKTGADPLRISTNFCNGVIHINSYNTWHSGHNKTNKDRYLMIVGLLLNVNTL